MGCFYSGFKNMVCACSLFLTFFLNSCVTKIVDANGKEVGNKPNPAQVQETQKAIVIRYLNNSQPNKAYSELKMLFQTYGEDNVSLNNLMGLTQLSLGNYDKALQYFNKSYSKEANPATGLNISSTYIAKGQNQKAVNFIKDLIKKFPNYTHYERYYHNLGVAYEGMNKINFALKYYKKALEENPNNYPSSLNMARLYKKEGKNQQAFQYFKNSGMLCELCLEPQKEISSYYVNEGDLKEARGVLEEYLSRQNLSYEDRVEAKKILKNIKNKTNKTINTQNNHAM